jgi:hypothetical protein
MARKKPGTQLATMADMENLYAAEAIMAAQAAPAGEGLARISTKSEMFTIGDQQLDDPLNLIVLADAHVNVWYPEAYDPDSPSPPGCFALAPTLQLDAQGKPVEGTGETALHAHESSPQRQGGVHDHDCATCGMNQWGSAERGKGKACGNTRLLAVVAADDPALGTEQEPKAALLGLSPTSLAPWGKFVTALSKVERRPPWGAVIRFTFDKKNKDERRRKAVIASGYQLITNPAIAHQILKMRKDILESKVLLRPLPTSVAEEGKPAKKAKGKGKEKKRAAARF